MQASITTAGEDRGLWGDCDERTHYIYFVFFFNDTAPTEIYTLSLHDALPISARVGCRSSPRRRRRHGHGDRRRRGEIGRAHVELQSRLHLACRLLLEKKKNVRSTTIR